MLEITYYLLSWVLSLYHGLEHVNQQCESSSDDASSFHSLGETLSLISSLQAQALHMRCWVLTVSFQIGTN